jgi:hypothetical protein
MPVPSRSSGAHTLVQALCLVVLAVVVIAVAYAVWMWVSNYSRVGV